MMKCQGTGEIGSLYRKPRFNEFAEKQPKCSLYRGMVNSCCFVFFFSSYVVRRRTTQHFVIGTITVNDICAFMSI